MPGYRKRGEFRIVLVADAFKETGRSAEELAGTYDVQQLTIETPNEGRQEAFRVPRELLLDPDRDTELQ